MGAESVQYSSIMNPLFRYRSIFFVSIVAAIVVVSTGCQQLPPKTDSPDTVVPAIPGTSVAWREPHWNELPGWDNDDLGAAWPAFRESCRAIGRKPGWAAVCAAANALSDRLSNQEVRQFFEQHFIPRQSVAGDGSVQGLVTGYYEPLIYGSRTQLPGTPWPILAPPSDMQQGSTYLTRAELEKRRVQGKLPARALFWTADPIDLFFLQVQGSGQIELTDGTRARVGFAADNGHPYHSIGRWLIDRGELAIHQASMEGIRQWVLRNPQRLDELLNSNPRYIFFRELPPGEGGPIGALGVPLHAERSIAVDPAYVPLGAPVFLSTTWPLSDKPLNRLVMAQDTGGAIKGAVRADFFWGFGDGAGEQAGKMRQQGKMWVLWPKGQN